MPDALVAGRVHYFCCGTAPGASVDGAPACCFRRRSIHMRCTISPLKVMQRPPLGPVLVDTSILAARSCSGVGSQGSLGLGGVI
jgi:hypothetical protein